MAGIEVSARGPIFDGRAQAAASAFASETQRYVAKKGADLVQIGRAHV